MKHKSVKYSVIATLFVMALFFGAVFAGFYFKSQNAESSAYFFGGASGLLIVAIANSLRLLKMKKNSQYRKEQEIGQKDERLVSLRNRAMAMAEYVTIISTAAASIISAVKGNMDNASNFSMILCISTAAYFIAYLILSHKE